MPKKYGTPGPRALDPKTAWSEPVARCSVEAQLLFTRLLAAADDQGRQKGHVLLVKATCMPLLAKAGPRAIERWLSELEAERLIIRYEAAGERLIQMRGWWDHQSNQKHIYRSAWPGPEGWEPDRVKGHGTESEPGGPSSVPDESPTGARPEPDGAPHAVAGAFAKATAGAGPRRVVVVYEELYGTASTQKARYLLNLEERFGVERAEKALRGEHARDPDPKTICGRMETALKRGDALGPATLTGIGTPVATSDGRAES